jgi:hypothetical protein
VPDEPLARGDRDFEVWPDNWRAVQTFAWLSTQWRMAPSGHLIGLDYAAVTPVLELLDVPRGERLDLFGDLRVMEAAAISEIRKRHG